MIFSLFLVSLRNVSRVLKQLLIHDEVFDIRINILLGDLSSALGYCSCCVNVVDGWINCYEGWHQVLSVHYPVPPEGWALRL